MWEYKDKAEQGDVICIEPQMLAESETNEMHTQSQLFINSVNEQLSSFLYDEAVDNIQAYMSHLDLIEDSNLEWIKQTNLTSFCFCILQNVGFPPQIYNAIFCLICVICIKSFEIIPSVINNDIQKYLNIALNTKDEITLIHAYRFISACLDYGSINNLEQLSPISSICKSFIIGSKSDYDIILLIRSINLYDVRISDPERKLLIEPVLQIMGKASPPNFNENIINEILALLVTLARKKSMRGTLADHQLLKVYLQRLLDSVMFSPFTVSAALLTLSYVNPHNDLFEKSLIFLENNLFQNEKEYLFESLEIMLCQSNVNRIINESSLSMIYANCQDERKEIKSSACWLLCNILLLTNDSELLKFGLEPIIYDILTQLIESEDTESIEMTLNCLMKLKSISLTHGDDFVTQYQENLVNSGIQGMLESIIADDTFNCSRISAKIICLLS